jgi:hypothetical protein
MFFAISTGHSSISGLKTIYNMPRPFQRALICEDWLFGIGVLRGRKTANNIDDYIVGWIVLWFFSNSLNGLCRKVTFHNCKQLLFYEFLKFRAEISAPGAWKSKNSKKNRFFHGVLRQNTVFFKSPGNYFRFSCSQLIFAPKKSQVVEYNFIQIWLKSGWSWQCLLARWKKNPMIFFLKLWS